MKAVIAVVSGVILGGIVNMALNSVSGKVIPLPPGVDPNDLESLKANMHLFEARHFIFPLLAHGMGSLVGAATAACLAPSHPMRYAIGIGLFTMLGGIAMVFMLPAPTWYIAADLIGCYLPMAWLGGKIGGTLNRSSAAH